jgi:hypothetical protein
MQCLVRIFCYIHLSLLIIESSERAVKYRQAVDRYARQYDHERLTDLEWRAIETVTSWLELYRIATSYMSSTKQTTLSSVYSILTALQDDLRVQLHRYDDSLPVQLSLGLQNALSKLSMYFSKTDVSPYYLWSSCASEILFFGT